MSPLLFGELFLEPDERFVPTVLDFFVDELRLDAAATRCVVLPALFFDAALLEEAPLAPALLADEVLADEVLALPRAAERAGDFFVVEVRDVVFVPDDRAPDFAAPDFAALDLARLFAAEVLADVAFLADVFADVAFFVDVAFLAAAFVPPFAVLFAALVFLAPVLRALPFAEPDADFAAALLVDEAPVFLAPVFLPLVELPLLLFLAGVDAEAVPPPALPVLVSLGFDLSSVAILASFKGLTCNRHACTRQRRYTKRVPIYGKWRK